MAVPIVWALVSMGTMVAALPLGGGNEVVAYTVVPGLVPVTVVPNTLL